MKEKSNKIPVLDVGREKKATGQDITFYLFLKSYAAKDGTLTIGIEEIQKILRLGKAAVNAKMRKLKRLGLLVATIQVINTKGKVVDFKKLSSAQDYLKKNGGMFKPSLFVLKKENFEGQHL